MLRTVVIRSSDRLPGGTEGDYQVRLPGTLIFEPNTDYYKVRVSNWNGSIGGTHDPSVVAYAVQLNTSFHQPYSFSTERTGTNDTLAVLSLDTQLEYIPMTQNFQTIVRRPTLETLRVWFKKLDGTAFTPGEHIFVLEFEPVPKK